MNLDPVRRALEPAVRRLLHAYWRFARGLTLGVRAVVIDPAGHVFLVRHSYVAGWHLPGGGVEAGETAGEALARELLEEGGITPTAPRLHGIIFFNARVSRRDHVAVYVVREFTQAGGPRYAHEIVAHGFFPPDALPEGTTRGTRARLAEVLNGAALSAQW
ncbi:MAG TPA: NUDIX domain-containing protein [Xanthobacteraceae bacterium]|nr:NUDIX domain-containing protein [Xanthobacteraceae bacterium]